MGCGDLLVFQIYSQYSYTFASTGYNQLTYYNEMRFCMEVGIKLRKSSFIQLSTINIISL